jgi:small-conductance mechanosensitive channel
LKFGESSLDFEVVYYVLDADYNVYMDIQQAVNLEIMERFEKENVEFAYPARTLFFKIRRTRIKPIVKPIRDQSLPGPLNLVKG